MAFTEHEMEDFDLFWKEVIVPATEETYEKLKDDKEFFKAADPSIVLTSENHDKMKLFYYNEREKMKSIYLSHQKDPKLDAHKLGSIICRMLIVYKVIKLNVDGINDYANRNLKDKNNDYTNWAVNYMYCNYKIAFLASVGVLYIDTYYKILLKQKQNKLSSSEKSEEKLNENIRQFDLDKFYCLKEYQKNNHHEAFGDSCILGLMFGDVHYNSFDYFSYATLLYQLQQHNLRLISNGEFFNDNFAEINANYIKRMNEKEKRKKKN